MQTHDFSNPLTAILAVGSGGLLGDWSIFITVLQIILLVVIAIVISGLGAMTLLLLWHRLFCSDDERTNGNRDRNNGDDKCQPRDDALAFELTEPSAGVEFKSVRRTLAAGDEILSLAMTQSIIIRRVLMVALREKHSPQDVVNNAHGVKSPNEKS